MPSLLAYGTQEQREAYVLPTLRGDLTWCQLFSEPGAGSDLASLSTRAERTGDGTWKVNGQKVWTSSAHSADYGILLARTDPDAPKHKGLGYFVVDMKNTPGIDIRPLKEITGEALFNEVWFDDAELPADALVGAADGGWKVARNTLGNERVHMADQMTFDTPLGLAAREVPPAWRRSSRAPPTSMARTGRGSAPSPPRRTPWPASGCAPPSSRCRGWSRARAPPYASSSRPRTCSGPPSSRSNCWDRRAPYGRGPGHGRCTACSCPAA